MVKEDHDLRRSLAPRRTQHICKPILEDSSDVYNIPIKLMNADLASANGELSGARHGERKSTGCYARPLERFVSIENLLKQLMFLIEFIPI